MTTTLEHTLACILIEMQYKNDIDRIMGEVALRDIECDGGLRMIAEAAQARAQKLRNIGVKV